jgi:hypothetical protein
MTVYPKSERVKGMWIGQSRAGHVCEFIVEGVSFEVWKPTTWTQKQIDKVVDVRNATFANMYNASWMASSSTHTTYITYSDAIDPTVSLRVTWLSQMIHWLMQDSPVGKSKVGDWSIEGVTFQITH